MCLGFVYLVTGACQARSAATNRLATAACVYNDNNTRDAYTCRCYFYVACRASPRVTFPPCSCSSTSSTSMFFVVSTVPIVDMQHHSSLQPCCYAAFNEYYMLCMLLTESNWMTTFHLDFLAWWGLSLSLSCDTT